MFNSVKSGFWHFLKGLNQQKDIVDLDCKIMFFGGQILGFSWRLRSFETVKGGSLKTQGTTESSSGFSRTLRRTLLKNVFLRFKPLMKK